MNNKSFGYIYTDYELGGVISISGDFILWSWSINYSHTAGNIYNMKCIEQPGFASFTIIFKSKDKNSGMYILEILTCRNKIKVYLL